MRHDMRSTARLTELSTDPRLQIRCNGKRRAASSAQSPSRPVTSRILIFQLSMFFAMFYRHARH